MRYVKIKRFWYDIETDSPYSPRGYLIDPELKFTPNENFVSNPIELDNNCILLLGEPGMGKTTIFNTYKSHLEEKLIDLPDEVLYQDIKDLDTNLYKKIKDHLKYKEWLKGNHRLYILIDSFDEWISDQKRLIHPLLQLLKQAPKDRLYLRIVCRTNYFPKSLINHLNILFRKKTTQLCISPLRKKDIDEWLTTAEINEKERFFKEIENKEIVPFAVRPITLKTMLNIFKKKLSLPTSKLEIYEKNCLILCDEVDEFRGKDSKYDPEQRYIVAARCAALCIFSGKMSIFVGSISDELPDFSISQVLIRKGQEITQDKEFDIVSSLVNETLNTGLFTSNGNLRIWAHWSFIEFLAADYIRKRELPIKKILSLIEHPSDPKNSFIPQFRGVIAWLCSFPGELFEIVLNREPEILIQADWDIFPYKLKKKILKKILLNYDKTNLTVRHFDLKHTFKKFNFHNIDEILREHLTNDKNSEESKIFAIEIIEECGLKVFVDNLIKILVDINLKYNLRYTAGYALKTIINNQEVKLENDLVGLKALALSDQPISDMYELKGIALSILWPENLTINEVLDHLPIPQYHSYFRFLLYDFFEGIREDDMLIVSNWVAKNLLKFGSSGYPMFFLDNFLATACEYVEHNSELLKKIIDLIYLIMKNIYLMREYSYDYKKFQLLLKSQLNLRKIIIRKLIGKTAEIRDLYYLTYGLSDKTMNSSYKEGKYFFILLDLDDYDFLNEEVTYSNDDNYKKKILHLLKHFSYLKEQVTSKIANKLNEKQTLEEDFVIDSVFQEKVSKLINEIIKGKVDKWNILVSKFTINHSGITSVGLYNPDLTYFQRWKDISSDMIPNMIKAAKKFLNEENFIGNSLMVNKFNNGYIALRLIFEFEKEYLLELPHEVWKSLITVIVKLRIQTFDSEKNEKENEIHKELLKNAYQFAKEEFKEALYSSIDYENENLGRIYILRITEDIWDDNLGGALLEKSLEDNIINKCKEDIFDYLLKNKYDHAKEFIYNFLSKGLPKSSEKRELSIKLAKSLVVHSDENVWNILWPLVHNDRSWGKNLIEAIRRDYHFTKKIFQNYSEEQIADVFIFLKGECYSIKEYLITIGTYDAVAALEKIIKEIPEFKTEFSYWIKIAQERASYKAWCPPNDSDIYELFQFKDSRLIQSGSQLIELIIEGLNHIEMRLQGQGSYHNEARVLWDHQGKVKKETVGSLNHKFEPIFEDEFSDYVCNCLNDYFDHQFIIHREVKVNNESRPDLIVTATSHDNSTEPIKVIIEVKGSWHAKVGSSMRTQLFEQYLKKKGFKYGIYLVGWFRTIYKTKFGSRATINKKKFGTIDILKNHLSNQLKEISDDNYLICFMILDASLKQIDNSLYK